jgi:hypothetical protein
MQHFEFRIQGLRPWPIVLFVATRNTESAKAMAERIRERTGRRALIDVWQAKRYLFTVGQLASMKDDHVIPSGFTTDFSI